MFNCSLIYGKFCWCIFLFLNFLCSINSVTILGDSFILIRFCISNTLSNNFKLLIWIFPNLSKESWAPKNWCFWTVVMENTLESPLDCKEIQSINPKGNQSWIFTGRTDEAETPILWPPDRKNWLIGKDPDAGKDWRREENGDNREWDGWMASLTQWTWVWVNSRSWWWTGRPGVLQSMGSQTVGHNWVTELNWGASLVTQW